MTSIASLHSSNLPIPPSCVAFSPKNQDLFIVGTYFLEKNENSKESRDEEHEEPKPQSRNGSLILYKVSGDEIIELQTIPTPSALLDLIFLPWSGYEHILVTATSTGTLSFYALTAEATLSHIHTHQCIDSSILLTDLEPHPSIPGLIGYVTSSGVASIIEFNLDVLSKAIGSGSQTDHWKDFVRYHHSIPCADEGFEAWTLAFVPTTSSPLENERRKVGVYTGSDDSTFRRLDFVLGNQTASVPPPSVLDNEESDNESADDDEDSEIAELRILDRRLHNAGVVAILPLVPEHPNLIGKDQSADKGEFILTGSYDDHIRLLYRPSSASTPQTRNQILAEKNLEGGVWRLRLIRHDRGLRSWIVLASCMHAGSRIVEVKQNADDEQWRIDVLAKFEEHKSMNYGSDVQPLFSSTQNSGVDAEGNEESNREETRTIVSTSFYDRLMCMWRIRC